jgi:hypothetical protein
MAQHIGTAGRSVSNSPSAFLAGTLLAVATMATVIVLALALGVSVQLRDGAAAGRPAALTPVGTYDGRLDPIENAYIRGAHAGAAAAPRSGVTIYDNRIDPIERAYISGARPEPRAAAVAPSLAKSGLSRFQLASR